MNYHSESTDRLFKTILDLESLEECYRFFEDLCTIKEIQDMAQRYDAANLLYDGVSYQKIAEQVSISSATISRVNRCLNYGDGGCHLHFHLVPKYRDEFEWGSTFAMNPGKVKLSEGEYQEMIEKIKENL